MGSSAPGGPSPLGSEAEERSPKAGKTACTVSAYEGLAKSQTHGSVRTKDQN